jgi:hypothetical protein
MIYVLNPFTNQILGCNDDVGGGNVKSTLSVTLTQPGEYDVYVTGSNGASGAYEFTATSSTGSVRRVYHGTGDGTNFTWRTMPYLSGMQFTQFNPNWQDLMDAVATPWSTYKVRLYALATGNPVYEYAWDGSSWAAYNLGGACGSTPTAISRGHGSIDLLCIGSDGKTLYWKRNSGGGVGLGSGAWGEWMATQGNHSEPISGELDVLSWNQNVPAVVSDASWRFSTSAPPGWASPTFNDSGWSYAVDQGEYGVGPWWTDLKRSGAPWWPRLSPARWIWSYDSRGDWGAGASTLYFRTSFTATKTDYVLNISADNGFTAYLNGSPWTSSTDWVTGATTSATVSWPVTMTAGQRYTIAVQVDNLSGPAGLLVDLR